LNRFEEEEIIIYGPYENHPSKFVALAFSSLLSLIVSPLVFFVVKYERDKSNRTLINQLLSSLILFTNIPTLIWQIFVYIRFAFGIAPELFCYLDLILKPGIAMLYILFLDAMWIVKYIFVFHSKNPAANQDDFWNRFLCIWMTSVSFLTHFVFVLLPGNNPNSFYICLGRVPAIYKTQETKRNLPLQCLMVVSAAAHVLVVFRYLIFTRQEKKRIGTGNWKAEIQRCVKN
jgi:hypothetical protein